MDHNMNEGEPYFSEERSRQQATGLVVSQSITRQDQPTVNKTEAQTETSWNTANADEPQRGGITESKVKYGSENEINNLMVKCCDGEKLESSTGVILKGYEEKLCIRSGAYRVDKQFIHKPREFIGKGAFGEVYLSHDVKSAYPFVQKNMKRSQTDKKMYAGLRREISTLLNFKSEHIVKLLGMIVNENAVDIFLEYGGTSLKAYLVQCKTSEEKLPKFVSDIFHQVLDGCCFLHRRSFVHCDLHLANIVITNRMFARVCDLGSVKSTDERLVTESHGNTPHYFPPTVLRAYLKVCYERDLQDIDFRKASVQNQLNYLQKTEDENKSRQTCLQEELRLLQVRQSNLINVQEEIQQRQDNLHILQEFQKQILVKYEEKQLELSFLSNRENDLYRSLSYIKDYATDLEMMCVSPRLDTFSIGKLMLEVLIGRHEFFIRIDEMESHLCEEQRWAAFVKHQLSQKWFLTLAPALCCLIEDLMNFKTKLDSETALSRFKSLLEQSIGH